MEMQMRGCLICGKPLIYARTTMRKRCAVCGKTYTSETFCVSGHFVCDSCHAKDSMSVIRAVCHSSDTNDPWSVALEIMRSPQVNIHGPEHHVIAGAALATAYCNTLGTPEKLAGYLTLIEQRGKKIPGGTCGFWGACGAALSAGVFLSVVTESTPLATGVYGLCNRLTSRCLAVIGNIGGPRCCKRNLGLSIMETIQFVREILGVEMSQPMIVCEFSSENRECIGARCPFFAQRHGG